MQAGTYLTSIDWATASIYAFWFAFATLILYLNSESKREGYPLVTPGKPKMKGEGFLPGVPGSKTFILPHGGTVVAPKREVERQVASAPIDGYPGSPYVPTGDAMVDGVGPAAYVMRADQPSLTYDDSTPAILPLRVLPEYSVDKGDPDPRGWPVVDADGAVAGTCVDLWLDKTESHFRYMEVSVPTDAGPRHVMIPVPLMVVSEDHNWVKVNTLLAKHFAKAPTLRNPDVITLREEDMVSAYCAGGQLYAKPERMGPCL